MNAGDREMLIQMRAEQHAIARQVEGMAVDMRAIRKDLGTDYVRKDVFEAAVRPIIRLFWTLIGAMLLALATGAIVWVRA